LVARSITFARANVRGGFAGVWRRDCIAAARKERV